MNIITNICMAARVFFLGNLSKDSSDKIVEIPHSITKVLYSKSDSSKSAEILLAKCTQAQAKLLLTKMVLFTSVL